jgi:hypothetical protein
MLSLMLSACFWLAGCGLASATGLDLDVKVIPVPPLPLSHNVHLILHTTRVSPHACPARPPILSWAVLLTPGVGAVDVVNERLEWAQVHLVSIRMAELNLLGVASLLRGTSDDQGLHADHMGTRQVLITLLLILTIECSGLVM